MAPSCASFLCFFCCLFFFFCHPNVPSTPGQWVSVKCQNQDVDNSCFAQLKDHHSAFTSDFPISWKTNLKETFIFSLSWPLPTDFSL